MCPFHTSSNKGSVQQVGLLENIRYKPVSRRDFFTFAWLEQYAQDFTRSLAALPRPIQILGGVPRSGPAEYLVENFAQYFRENEEVDYIFPLWQDGTSEAEESKGFRLGDREIRPRMVNKDEKRATCEIKYVDYRTGKSYQSPTTSVDPNRTKVELITKLPSGFEGGVEVSTNSPIETRHILKLKLTEKAFHLKGSPVLHFSIPVGNILPIDVQTNNSLLSAGKDGELMHISDILSVVSGNTILLDRNLLLQVFEEKGAVDGMLVVQLEGKFKKDLKLDTMAQRFLPGSRHAQGEIRFETTAEAIPVYRDPPPIKYP